MRTEVAAVRTSLTGLSQRNSADFNAGIELDYLIAKLGDKATQPPDGDGKNAVDRTYDRVCAAETPEIYQLASARRNNDLTAMGAVGRVWQVTSRMIVGLGAESTRETSVSLLRPYGVPYIPGSALKGLARHYAEAHGIMARPGHVLTAKNVDLSDENANAHAVLFGSTDAAGYVDFLDAWYEPNSAPADRSTLERGPLRRDVITVHHPNYYSSSGKDPQSGTNPGPWDFDDPIPVPFLSAIGKYKIWVKAPDATWAKFTLDLLQRSLAEWGIGAKTSSGYGRLVPVVVPPHPDIEVLGSIPSDGLAGRLNNYVRDQWPRLPEEARPGVADALFARARRGGLQDRQMTWKNDIAPYRAQGLAG